MQYTFRYASPLGGIRLSSDGEALTGLCFGEGGIFAGGPGEGREEKALPVFGQAGRWLDIYFDGREPDFPPPLRLSGTPFRLAVWELLRQIPYGHTTTYGELAAGLARQRGLARMSAQAVGGAVGHNPLAILIPCHRVVGADGSLTGYAGGLRVKEALLRLEKADIRFPGEGTDR